MALHPYIAPPHALPSSSVLSVSAAPFTLSLASFSSFPASVASLPSFSCFSFSPFSYLSLPAMALNVVYPLDSMDTVNFDSSFPPPRSSPLVSSAVDSDAQLSSSFQRMVRQIVELCPKALGAEGAFSDGGHSSSSVGEASLSLV